MRPSVPFTPTTPDQPAGRRIDPPMSEPVARWTSPAASAAAEPPLDPPGVRSRFQGLRVGAVQHRARVGEVADLRRRGQADGHGAGGQQAASSWCVVPVAMRSLAGGAGARVGPALHRLELLDAEGHAGQRTRVLALGDAAVDVVGHGPGPVGVDEHERVELRVDALDPVEARPRAPRAPSPGRPARASATSPRRPARGTPPRSRQ